MEPHLGRLQLDVLYFIRLRGVFGATCDEVEEGLSMTHQTASARVHELAKQGKIIATVKRRTRSGRNATVWVAVRAQRGAEGKQSNGQANEQAS